MTRATVTARIHAALAKFRVCHDHARTVPPGQGFSCDYCLLEQKTGRRHRTINQIMAGVVPPSWERERI